MKTIPVFCHTTSLPHKSNWEGIDQIYLYFMFSVAIPSLVCLGWPVVGLNPACFVSTTKSPPQPLTSPIFGLFAICYLLIAPARQRLCVLHHRHICQVSDFNWVLAFLRKRRCFWSPLRVGFPCIFPLLLTHLLPHSLAWTLGLSGALHWDSDSFWCLVDIFLTSWAIPCAQAY